MANYRVISSDSHVNEPEDLWTSRADSKFKDRVPHIERLENGDYWFYDGIKGDGAGGSAHVGQRFEEPEKLGQRSRIEETRLGGYIPEEHVKDMDIDGVDAGLIYPTVGIRLYSVPASDILTYSCRLYNDWVGEFCSAVPKRLKGIAMLNVDDVGGRCKGAGTLRQDGLCWGYDRRLSFPGRSYDKPEYEPLWAAAQDMGVPLSLHAATNRAGEDQQFADLDTIRPSFLTMMSHWAAISLGDIIFSGAFERYPKLYVGSVEHELSWVPHFLDRMDYTYTQRAMNFAPYRFKRGCASQRHIPQQLFSWLPGRCPGHKAAGRYRSGHLNVGVDYPHGAPPSPGAARFSCIF